MRVFMVLVALVAAPFVAGVSQAPGGSSEPADGGGAAGANLNCVQSGDFQTADGLVCAGAVTLGQINGTVFQDVFGTGVRDPSDPGIPNAVLLLTGPVILQMLTDVSGNYAFTGVPAGTYVLCEAQRATWLQTVPASGTSCGPSSWGYTITLAPGQIAIGMDFGNMFF
jgi:hypothetical protein